ncbi:MAG: hypothetical protein JKX69_09685 [Rhodobacteraceae bacterium]|nr:hypothetical protein [Paracoccaceae bacterium]
MTRIGLAAVLALAAVSGCSTMPDGETLEQSAARLEFSNLEASAYRAYAQSFSDMPFADGAVSVIAPHHHGLGTYLLVPCNGGRAVCQGAATGRVGTVTTTPDYVIVSGLYGNRTFWLSPGGDGAVRYANGRTVPLAWE